VISLVIVSHSHQLAEGVKELAEQMAQSSMKIAAIGGIVDEAGQSQLGTEALLIAKAVETNWSEDGVLLLVDMGSAVLSAELALEMLPVRMQQQCLISNAPLVEGAIVAAVEASCIHDLQAINQAAEEAGQFIKVAR
jgi:dihydroxyacetone kinase phosphotransfer subunit